MNPTPVFVNPEDVKRSSFINGNLDVDNLMPFILIAQQMHVQNFLGSSLYNRISNDISNGTLTGDYLNLVNDYIQPMCIAFAMVDYIPFSGFSIKNGGIFKHTSENAEIPDKEDINFLTQRYINVADFYTRRFIDYMSFNASTKFPEYYNNVNDDMYPDKSANFVSFVT